MDALTGIARRNTQAAVESYWDEHPCDSDQSARPTGTRPYFDEIEAERYRHQPHILRVIRQLEWRDRNVLEIGTGAGTDARQLIAQGAHYTGINVDAGSCRLTRRALRVFGVRGHVRQMSAVKLQFGRGAFDAVYSFGVLHHVPDVDRAIDQIHRVLRPGGDFVLMVYNRSSVNYHVEIMRLRRWALALVALPGAVALLSKLGFPGAKLARHAEVYRRGGRISDQEWLSRNTDGPDNPYSRVYDGRDVERLLEGRFAVRSQRIFYFEPRHWGPLGRLMPPAFVRFLGARWGWHRVVHAVKV